MLSTPLAVCILFCWAVTAVVIKPENVFSAGKLSYRRLLLDAQSSSLYVGADGHLFRLWAYNINDTITDGLHAHLELSVSNAEADECHQSGHADCLNAVRLMFLKEGGQTLLVCSSNAMKPQLRELDAFTLGQRSAPENVIGVCTAHTNLNTTAVLVEWGNPDDIPAIYSGIRTGLTLDNHLIYRPPLMKNNKELHPSMRTIYTDSKWLKDPDFVSSLSFGKYVYFFFREVAVEREGCGSIVYSRVARICKKDVGGKNVLRQVWTTFVKARLNCSTGGENPVNFDQIQSLQSVESKSDVLIYATFTTPDIAFGGSSICAFSLTSINKLFDHGNFAEQVSSGGRWTATPVDDIPRHRPGTCVANSASVSDSDLHFARSHLLMVDSVSADQPLFTLRGELFTFVAVDQLDDVNVVFVYSHNTHQLYKLAHWIDGHSTLLATYSLIDRNIVHAVTLLSGKFLYISGEQSVEQYSVAQCIHHRTCSQCAIDPYCSWNLANALCQKRDKSHSASPDWAVGRSGATEKCVEQVKHVEVTAFGGDVLHFRCEVPEPEWYFDERLIIPSDKRQITTEGGLIVFNASVTDNGSYRCVMNDQVVAVYSISVDEGECAQPTSLVQFKSKYREWCKKLSNYKNSIENWYSRNNENCPKHVIAEDFRHASIH